MTTPEQTPAVDDVAKKKDTLPDDLQETAGPQTHLIVEALQSDGEAAEQPGS